MNDDRRTAIYRAERAHEVELNRATAAFEHAVLTPLFLLNGGAAVAFLTLLGAASSEESTLDINRWLGGIAVLCWSVGLVAATWAARKGYESQREFTRAVNLRRRLLERALISDSAEFRHALRPLPSEQGGDRSLGESIKALAAKTANDPQVPLEEGKALQGTYLTLTTTSSGLFVLGVAAAAGGVLV